MNYHVKYHRRSVAFTAFVACTLFACVASAEPATGPATKPEAASKFLRYQPDGKGGGTLATSVVTYKNAAGATVDLIGAVHVADAAYFRALQTTFTRYDALLYEMVKPKEAEVLDPKRRQAKADEGGGAAINWVGMIQHGLKNTLKLSFQLDEIDYTKKNFIHADLDAETFEKMQDERGESLLGLMLKQAIRELARGSGANTAQLGLPDILMALQDPEAARRLKLILAKQFANMDDLIAGLDDPEKGSVLLTERNKAALNVVDERLRKGDRRIGVFYGAAHLSGMEKMLSARGFKETAGPVWLTAWDMTAPATRPATRPTLRPVTRPATRTSTRPAAIAATRATTGAPR